MKQWSHQPRFTCVRETMTEWMRRAFLSLYRKLVTGEGRVLGSTSPSGGAADMHRRDTLQVSNNTNRLYTFLNSHTVTLIFMCDVQAEVVAHCRKVRIFSRNIQEFGLDHCFFVGLLVLLEVDRMAHLVFRSSSLTCETSIHLCNGFLCDGSQHPWEFCRTPHQHSVWSSQLRPGTHPATQATFVGLPCRYSTV